MNSYFLLVLILLITTQYIIHEQNIYLNSEEYDLTFKVKYKNKILYTLKNIEWLYIISLIPYANKLLILVYAYVLIEKNINKNVK